MKGCAECRLMFQLHIELNAEPDGSRPTRVHNCSPPCERQRQHENLEMLWIETGLGIAA